MSIHNAEQTVNLALRSTLLALPRNSELIVLLNACTDKTRAVIEAIKDKRLIMLSSDIALSPGDRLNRLLKLAVGKFVARMDADDVCLPWRFAYELAHLRQNQSDLIFTNAVLFGSTSSKRICTGQRPVALNSEQISMALTFTNPLVHPTMLAKREVLLELGGYRDVPADDLDLWLRAALAGYRIRRLRGYGIFYRIHSGQLTQNPQWQLAHRNSEVISKLREKLKTKVNAEISSVERASTNLGLGERFVTSSIPVMIQFLGFKRLFHYFVTRKIISYPWEEWGNVR
jgi:glycosyltransferase involved in cell wall biosynthesis